MPHGGAALARADPYWHYGNAPCLLEHADTCLGAIGSGHRARPAGLPYPARLAPFAHFLFRQLGVAVALAGSAPELLVAVEPVPSTVTRDPASGSRARRIGAESPSARA